MKIIINGGSLKAKEIYGVQRNTIELLKEIDKKKLDMDIELLVPESGTNRFEFTNIQVVEKKEAKFIKKMVWNHFIFPYYVRKNKGYGLDSVLALPLWGCDAAFIYDCITEKFPENSKTLREKLSRWFYIFRVKSGIKRYNRIFTDSECAKRDICELYKVAPEKITVLYCGWQHFSSVCSDESIVGRLGLSKGEFFFSLGSRYIHKNFRWVKEAAKLNPQYKFVISGSSSLNSSDSYLDNGKENNLIFTGYLSDEEIKGLMTNCKAFIQPSLYEGFGIPPMEAMSTGADCIVSNKSSLPEVYGKTVWYIDPYNYDTIDIDSIMSTPKESNKSTLENYSWEKSAILLVRILAEIAGE